MEDLHVRAAPNLPAMQMPLVAFFAAVRVQSLLRSWNFTDSRLSIKRAAFRWGTLLNDDFEMLDAVTALSLFTLWDFHQPRRVALDIGRHGWKWHLCKTK